MTPLERAVLALAQHEDDTGDEPGVVRPQTIEDVRRHPVSYAQTLAGVRAVIEAISDPLIASAGVSQVVNDPNDAGRFYNRGVYAAAGGLAAMIDAILEESE